MFSSKEKEDHDLVLQDEITCKWKVMCNFVHDNLLLVWQNWKDLHSKNNHIKTCINILLNCWRHADILTMSPMICYIKSNHAISYISNIPNTMKNQKK